MKKAGIGIALWLLTFTLSAAVTLPALFSDHAVLARRAAVPVWGKADPGEKVAVSLGKVKSTAVAGKEGRWCVVLNLADSPAGPFELHVNDKVVKDVVVGELWLCSGQSNMQFRLRQALQAKTELARSDWGLRCFTVPTTPAPVPQQECGGKWIVCNPDDSGEFSAVAYFFGKKLRQELNTPVGLIHSSYGGTSISSWIPAEITAKFPEEVKEQQAKLKIYQEYPAKLKRALTGLKAWEEKFNRTDSATHTLPGTESVWKPVPQVAAYAGVPGAVWFRNEFELSEIPKDPAIAWIRQWNRICCYINGVKVAEHSAERAMMRESFSPRIPRKLLKVGKNEILFRVFCSHKAPTFAGGMVIAGTALYPQKWQACVERKLPAVTADMRRVLPEFPNYSAPDARRLSNYLYNGMIAPLRPATLSGILWYQGENDIKIAERYAAIFPEMIQSWRKDFKNPNLPFFYCQLPAHSVKQDDPGTQAGWIKMRTAQDSALALPHTGGAILVDVGEAYDVHYLDKTLPGERLAALALAQVYGKKIVSQSPRLKSCTLKDGKIHLQFNFIGSGLVARPLPEKYPLTLLTKKYADLKPHLPGSPLQGFAVCNQDGKWHWAKAEIVGNEVVITPPISSVVKVRYAQEDNPTCNLYNREGFPAAPFQCPVDEK